MLALLPDNSTGEISAADLRSVVTGLWNRLTSVSREPYKYTTTAIAAGQVTVSSWAVGSAVVSVSETTRDNATTPWISFESGLIWLKRNDGSGEVIGTITGTPVVQSGYRDVPVNFTEASGTAPGNNADVTLATVFEMDLS